MKYLIPICIAGLIVAIGLAFSEWPVAILCTTFALGGFLFGMFAGAFTHAVKVTHYTCPGNPGECFMAHEASVDQRRVS